MVRRVGGAYGGKCSRSMPVAAAAALAARVTGQRTRLTLNRNDDMRLNGGAHGPTLACEPDLATPAHASGEA